MSDTDLTGCVPCKGRGKILGLGVVMQDCEHCNGVGWIQKVSEIDEAEFWGLSDSESITAENNDFLKGLPENTVLLTKKKPGRPKLIKGS